MPKIPALDIAYEQFNLHWTNHEKNLLSMTKMLLRTEAFADVTITTYNGEIVKGHKLVLAANSLYFEDLFMKNPCKTASIILQDITYEEMVKLMDYMYTGQTTVTRDDMKSLLRAGKCLRIKGLSDKTDNADEEEEFEPPASPAPTYSSNGYVAGYSNGHAYGSPPATPSINSNHYEASPENLFPQNSWTNYPNNVPLLQNAISELQSRAAQRKKKPILGNSYVKPSEKSPLSRKKKLSLVATQETSMLKQVLDQSDDYNDASLMTSSSNSSMGNSRRDSGEFSVEDDKPVIHARKTSSTKQKNGERKYKQYSQEMIHQAIQAVKEHKMGALEAAKFFCIPSRTLYDKLKKAGVEPARGSNIKKLSGDYDDADNGAKFPYYDDMKDSVYGGKSSGANDESENGDALSESNLEDSRRIGRSNENLVMDIGSDRSRSPSPERSASKEVNDISVAKSSNSVVEDISVIVQPDKDVAAGGKEEMEEEMDTAESKTGES